MASFFPGSSEVCVGFLLSIFLSLEFSLNISKDLFFSAVLSTFLVSILCVCFSLSSPSWLLFTPVSCQFSFHALPCPALPPGAQFRLCGLFRADGRRRLEILTGNRFLSVAKPCIGVCSDLRALHCPGQPAGASWSPGQRQASSTQPWPVCETVAPVSPSPGWLIRPPSWPPDFCSGGLCPTMSDPLSRFP